MKRIPVWNNGLIKAWATVDDDDYEAVSVYRWYYSSGYAVANVRRKGSGRARTTYMHTFILGHKPGWVIDHIDRNRRNNRRSNLRHARNWQNLHNTVRPKNFLGLVGIRKSKYKYRVTLCHDGKIIYIGTYHTIAEAVAQYERAAKEVRGEFYVRQNPRRLPRQPVRKCHYCGSVINHRSRLQP